MNVEAEEVAKNLSYTQYALLCVSCWSGCFLSCLGSATILYCARYKLSNLYHRTLAILSVFDIVNSISWALHPVVFNARGTPGLYWATGNLQSCAAGGFFAVGFCLPMWLYSAFLSVYFLLIIRYRWPDQMIANYFEKPAFTLATGISFTGATLGVITKSFNPRPNDLLCLSQGYPYQCETNPDVECIRGGEATNAGLIIVMVAVFSGLCGLVCTCLIYGTVWAHTRRHRQSRYSLSSRMERRLQQVASQSILYFFVYLNVFIWPLGTNLIYGVSTTSGAVEDRTSLGPFTYSLISWFFFPITGFCNCVVYLRPRYMQWRTCRPQEGRKWAVAKAIGSDQLPMSDKSRRQVQVQAERQEFEGIEKAVELYESRELSAMMTEPQGLTKRKKEQVGGASEQILALDEEDEEDETKEEEGVTTEVLALDTLGIKTETERNLDSIVR